MTGTKSLLAALMTVLLLTGAAWADAAEEPITWQGIPWESSVQETVEALLARGVIADAAEMQLFEEDAFKLLYDEAGIIPAYENAGGFPPQANPAYAVIPAEYMIAGYRTQAIGFSFAFDGAVSKLVAVTVMLELPRGMNQQEMTADLQAKLSQVYGESSLWNNALPEFRSGNTFLYLAPDYAVQMLCYGTGKCLALLEEASRSFADEAQQPAAPAGGDISGL